MGEQNSERTVKTFSKGQVNRQLLADTRLIHSQQDHGLAGLNGCSGLFVAVEKAHLPQNFPAP